jgi:hypothetical protein
VPARFARWAALVACALAGAACMPARSAETVSLRLRGNVADASVTIDDQYVGALAFVAKRGVALPPGEHRITVERAGFFPWDRLVDAKRAPLVLEVKLERVPD